MNPAAAPMWLTALSVTMQLLPTVIVGIQHLMPGSSGADKKNAVVTLAGAALAGTEAMVPTAAPAVDIIGNSVANIIQGMFDIIKHKQPQALLVHPQNTIDGGTPTVTDAKTGAVISQGSQSQTQADATSTSQPQTSGLG